MQVLRAAIFSIASDEESVELLLELLPRVYRNVRFEYGGALQPPPSAYNPARGQYVSDVILELVREAVESHGYGLGLGVAGFDAYTPGLNFVFGQALLGRGVAVVYTPRLRQEFYGLAPNPRLYRERLLKEAMHELGHALGLEHCTVPGCVMNFSNSIMEVDAKKAAYCQACSLKLRAVGVEVSEAYTLPY